MLNPAVLMSCGRAADAVSDLTYIPVGSCFSYLSVVMDGYSRKIIGWSLCNRLEAKGSIEALDMALSTRPDTSKSVIHHCAGSPVRSGCPVLFKGVCRSTA